ncbi:MAG: ABC transporter ATP-binding protein [Dehalococcoidia bacterium]|nr:ABC transporter ATP-binding protein [Dehalococcoidia bacterium]
MSQLCVESVTKAYANNNKERHVVLRDLSFGVRTGEFVSLLGPSGCGKTTILRIIAGFLKPTSGRIMIGDDEVTQPGPDRAFVFQSYGLFPWMTIKANILYPMQQQKMPQPEQEQQLNMLLALAKLEGKEKLYPHQLSGGMQQRTAVIRALACHPKVLLMDEPLGAVDMQMRHKLQEDMERIFIDSPATVVMVTHDVDEAVFMSNRILVMSDCEGKLAGDLSIPLPHPRNRHSLEYQQLVSKLGDLLQNMHHEKEISDWNNIKNIMEEIPIESKAADCCCNAT